MRNEGSEMSFLLTCRFIDSFNELVVMKDGVGGADGRL
jgi:hypothetical protein